MSITRGSGDSESIHRNFVLESVKNEENGRLNGVDRGSDSRASFFDEHHSEVDNDTIYVYDEDGTVVQDDEQALRVWPWASELPPRLVLENVTISAARAIGAFANGGAIAIDSTVLTLVAVTVHGCAALSTASTSAGRSPRSANPTASRP